MSATAKTMFDEVSNRLSEIEEAHVEIGILFRAISYITEKGADFLRTAPDTIDRRAALPHLEMAFGLTNIAEGFLRRADRARLAADDAMFVKREPTS